MESGDQHFVWTILTANEVEILKKAMPPDEPELVDELNKAMQSVRDNGNVCLEEKVEIMLKVVKAVAFLIESIKHRNDDVVVQEEGSILRNLTKFAGFLIRKLSLNDVVQLIKVSVTMFFNLLQTGSVQGQVQGQGLLDAPGTGTSSSSGVDPSGQH